MDYTRILAQLCSGSGPDIPPEQARQVVTELKQAWERSWPIIGELTQLSTPKVPARIVDRPTWAQVAAKSIDQMLGESQVEGKSADRYITAALSLLSPRVLGQWDPFSAPPAVFFIAPNIADFALEHNCDYGEVALWVAVHEGTHAAQFAAAPWLPGYLSRRAQALSAGERETREDTLAELTCVMSVLEGHATYITHHISLTDLPRRSHLIQANAAKRVTGVVGHIVAKMLKLSQKKEQYRAGLAFVEQAISQGGMAHFNRIWDDPKFLPTPSELADPQLWLLRVSR